MTDARKQEGWCWVQDDPEMTYPDPSEWVSENAWGRETIIQRFDWGIPAPSSWVVVTFTDDEREFKEFDTEAAAVAFAAQAKVSS